MKRFRATNNQREIIDRLKAGDRLTGPVLCSSGRRYREERPWGWPDGRSVSATSIEGLRRRGILRVTERAGEREASLVPDDAVDAPTAFPAARTGTG